MQLMGGNIQATTGVKGIGDLFGKALKGAVTKESAVKPEYVEDGMFLACDARVKRNVIARKNISSAVLGGRRTCKCISWNRKSFDESGCANVFFIRIYKYD